MNYVPIKAVPNQDLTILLNGSRYIITIKETRGVMAASVTRNGVKIVDNQRIVAGTFILPYQYQEDGNFYMTNLGEALIYYPEFSQSQNLAYVTPFDLYQLRGV